MAEKTELLTQKELVENQAETMEEIKAHIVKAQSDLELVTNSLETKAKEGTDDISSELNSLSTVYDQLEHAFLDAEQVEDFLKEAEVVDERNA